MYSGLLWLKMHIPDIDWDTFTISSLQVTCHHPLSSTRFIFSKISKAETLRRPTARVKAKTLRRPMAGVKAKTLRGPAAKAETH